MPRWLRSWGAFFKPQAPAREWLRRTVVALLLGYRRFVSPLLPPACRFHPTCSAYAVEAIEQLGLVRGGWKALRRLLRCHPFNPGGFDPVAPPRGGRVLEPRPGR